MNACECVFMFLYGCVDKFKPHTHTHILANEVQPLTFGSRGDSNQHTHGKNR